RAAISVAEPEIEITAYGDEKPGETERQGEDETGPVEERRRIPIERRGEEGEHPGAAKEAPEGQALPAAGFRCRPDTERGKEKGAQKQEIERDAGDQPCGEDDMCEIEVKHGTRRKKTDSFCKFATVR